MVKMNKLKSILENTLKFNVQVLFEFWYLPSFEDKYYIQVGFNSYNNLILKYIYTNNIDTFSNIIYLDDVQSKMILDFVNLDFNITTQKDVLIIDGIYYTIRFKNIIYSFEKGDIPNEYFKIYTLCKDVLKMVK